MVKASVWNLGDPGSIPESGRSPGEGNGNPLQYSCLGNPRMEEPGEATVHGGAESQTRLSDFTFTFIKHIYTNKRLFKCLSQYEIKCFYFGGQKWIMVRGMCICAYIQTHNDNWAVCTGLPSSLITWWYINNYTSDNDNNKSSRYLCNFTKFQAGCFTNIT